MFKSIFIILILVFSFSLNLSAEEKGKKVNKRLVELKKAINLTDEQAKSYQAVMKESFGKCKSVSKNEKKTCMKAEAPKRRAKLKEVLSEDQLSKLKEFNKSWMKKVKKKAN